jgi:nitrite reductase (NADH) large subunit
MAAISGSISRACMSHLIRGLAATSVVVGHGMVRPYGSSRPCGPVTPQRRGRITVLAEEAEAAYDRVGLTGYTEHWDRSLSRCPAMIRRHDLVSLRLSTRVHRKSTAPQGLVLATASASTYDALVLATGSYAFVPPVPGRDLPSCHVYRTRTNLGRDPADAERARRAGHARRVGDRWRPARLGSSQCSSLVRPSCPRRRDAPR